MMKIYTAQISNECQSILPAAGTPIATEILFNHKSLLSDWQRFKYDFRHIDDVKAKPNVSLIGGALCVRADLKDKIFPSQTNGLEFLPIRVSEEDWYLVNCLNETDRYDTEESILYSGPDKQIFMILHLVITDPGLQDGEIFVLKQSNRTTLFLFPSIVDRFLKLKLKGVNFKEIGYLRDSDDSLQTPKKENV